VLPEAATVHWGVDGWTNVRDDDTREAGLGLHSVDLPTRALPAGSTVELTFRWRARDAWEGRDYRVEVGERTESSG
ncbi:MAG: hypothetical protein WCB49_07200, partial [Gammaproteobacteria bacterium]